jgi:hypothetical protein
MAVNGEKGILTSDQDGDDDKGNFLHSISPPILLRETFLGDRKNLVKRMIYSLLFKSSLSFTFPDCITHVFPGTPATRRDGVSEVDSDSKTTKESKEDDDMPQDATNEKDDSGDDTDSDDSENTKNNEREKVL